MLKFLLRSAVATGLLAVAKKVYDRVAPKVFAATVIDINGSDVRCTKGTISASGLRAVQRALSERGITEGKIRVAHDHTVRFSTSIPASEHQRLRNIVLNA